MGTRTYDSETLMLKAPNTSVIGHGEMKPVLTRKLMIRIARFSVGCNSGMAFMGITNYSLLGFLIGSLHKR